jgi:hypothetical protein
MSLFKEEEPQPIEVLGNELKFKPFSRCFLSHQMWKNQGKSNKNSRPADNG